MSNPFIIKKNRFVFILRIEKILDLNCIYVITNFNRINIVLAIYELDENRLNYQLRSLCSKINSYGRTNETNRHHRIATRFVPIPPANGVFSMTRYPFPIDRIARDAGHRRFYSRFVDSPAIVHRATLFPPRLTDHAFRSFLLSART